MTVSTTRDASSVRTSLLALAVVAIAVTLALAIGGRADAATPVVSLDMAPVTTQAGAHPDIVTQFEIINKRQQPPVPCDCNAVKEITISAPPGLVGSPTDVPRCTQSEFAVLSCPTDSQIGFSFIDIGEAGTEDLFVQPLYNLVPPPDELALWGTFTPFVPLPAIFTAISARTDSDYGLDLRTFGIPSTPASPPRFAIVTWGVPAEPKYDQLRYPATLAETEQTFHYSVDCSSTLPNPFADLLASLIKNRDFPAECEVPSTLVGFSANYPPVPYFSNPTTCSGPLTASIETVAFDLERDFLTSAYPETIGCDQLSFDPSLTAKPTTVDADSPSGIDVDVRVPQSLGATTLSPSHIRGVSVRLPEGFTINPGSADGKTSCSDAEARFGTREQAQCPEFAKIGTLEIESAALPRELPGAIYLGRPLPGDRYRVFLTADGFSVHLKLPGTAVPDPRTGRLTISFRDLPQAPFQRFRMHIFGAERGLLATPTRCGTYAVESEFVPWAAELPNQTSTQFFEIDAGPGGTPCPGANRGFDPSLTTGLTDNTGGQHSEFAFDLTRRDGDQSLSGVEVVNPPGFSAVLAGIPYCPEATLASLAAQSYLGTTELTGPACAASQVGTSIASAGPGSRPVSLSGRVYLAGPYRGAPLSLAVVTPAVSGPYDLGNVVVRVAVRVDPRTARVSAVSDALPRIVEGVPLRLRRVLITLDRSNFVLNPTNCDPFSIEASVVGDEGARRDLSSHFQVANCGTLPFEPRLSIRLSGGFNRLGHPAIRAEYRASRSEANARRISVTLPKGELLDQSHIRTICTRVAFAANACPAGSVLGRARAITPLLDEPLEGPVVLRSSSNRLPDLVVDLTGQFDFELVGRVDSVDGRLRTTFDAVPDVPVTRFVLNLLGGNKGLLINSEPLCGATKRATVRMRGQNGAAHNVRTKLLTSCGAARRKRQLEHRKAG
jgi:hypothetical protein